MGVVGSNPLAGALLFTFSGVTAFSAFIDRRLAADDPVSGTGCAKCSLEQHTAVCAGYQPALETTRGLATHVDPQPTEEPYPIVLGGALLAIGICGFILMRLKPKRPKRH